MPPNTPNNNFQPPGPPTNTPGVYGPNSSISGGSKNRKLPFIIIGAVAIVFIILIILAVILSSNQSSTEPEPEAPASVEPEGPQPATSLDVENTANSITQDISSLNDEQDFPDGQLSDDELNL